MAEKLRSGTSSVKNNDYHKKLIINSKFTLGSLIPVKLVWGLSKTRKAAKLAVYEATIIIANPAQTIPSTLAEKLLGVPENNYSRS